MPSRPTACASRSSTTKSTTASCARSWPATSPRPRPRSATHCASSTTKSPGASPQHDSRQPPDQPRRALHPQIADRKTQDKRQSPRKQAPLEQFGSMPAARGMDERGCRSAQPLGHAHREGHIGHARRAQIGQPTRGAADLLGQSRPGQPLPPPLLVERGMELGEVPSEPTSGPGSGSRTSPTSRAGPVRNSSGACPSQRSR